MQREPTPPAASPLRRKHRFDPRLQLSATAPQHRAPISTYLPPRPRRRPSQSPPRSQHSPSSGWPVLYARCLSLLHLLAPRTLHSRRSQRHTGTRPSSCPLRWLSIASAVPVLWCLAASECPAGAGKKSAIARKGRGCTCLPGAHCAPKSPHGRLRQPAGEGVCAPAQRPAHGRKGRGIRKHIWRQSRHGRPLPDHDLAAADKALRPRCDHVEPDRRHDAASAAHAAADQWLRSAPSAALRPARRFQCCRATPNGPAEPLQPPTPQRISREPAILRRAAAATAPAPAAVSPAPTASRTAAIRAATAIRPQDLSAWRPASIQQAWSTPLSWASWAQYEC
jgi:hypothetical protein